MKPYSIFLTLCSLTLISLAACQPNSTAIQAKSTLQPKGSWLEWIGGSTTVSTPPKQFRPCFINIPLTTHHPPYWLLATSANTGNLKEANNDAQRFKEVIQKRYSIPVQQVCVLGDVYRQELIDALQELKARVTEKDLVIVYFSGHGWELSGVGEDEDMVDEALVTYDVQNQNLQEATRCDEYVLKDKWLVKLVNALPTARVLTVIDACFSGGMYMPPTIDRLPEARLKYFGNRCLGTQLPPYTPEARKQLDKLKGLFLAASAEDENAQSWEIPGGGGIFTTELVEALAQAPLGQFQEAFKRAAERVSKQIKELKQKEQHPKDRGAWEVVE